MSEAHQFALPVVGSHPGPAASADASQELGVGTAPFLTH